MEEGTSVKKPRAPAANDYVRDPKQGIDEEEDEEDRRKTLPPPGFLSASVQEYLELGKSIPGSY